MSVTGKMANKSSRMLQTFGQANTSGGKTKMKSLSGRITIYFVLSNLDQVKTLNQSSSAREILPNYPWLSIVTPVLLHGYQKWTSQPTVLRKVLKCT
jgi:hypothetical protein